MSETVASAQRQAHKTHTKETIRKSIRVSKTKDDSPEHEERKQKKKTKLEKPNGWLIFIRDINANSYNTKLAVYDCL